MSTLQARLERAMDHAELNQAALAKACKISTAAVAKWFAGNAKNLKMENLFAVAEVCGVEAKWLGTGAGPMVRTKGDACTHQDIPQRRIELIRMYSRLPDEVRFPIRQLIETLALMQNPRHAEYVKRQRKPEMVHDE